jgi:hypothetical protein
MIKRILNIGYLYLCGYIKPEEILKVSINANTGTREIDNVSLTLTTMVWQVKFALISLNR